MFVWAPLPEAYREMGSLEFFKVSPRESTGAAVSPGVGFGPMGENYVRFALIENPHRIRQATTAIKRVLKAGR